MNLPIFKEFTCPLTVGDVASEIVSLYDMPLPELVEAWNRACSDLFNPPTP